MSMIAASGMPRYISSDDGRPCLDSRQLSNPEIFLDAVRDFARLACQKKCNTRSYLLKQHSYEDIIEEAGSILFRSKYDFDTGADSSGARRVIYGFAGELFMRNVLQELIATFHEQDNLAPHLLDCSDIPVPAKGKYVLQSGLGISPLSHTNIIVHGFVDEVRSSIGEIDMLLETHDKSAFIIDVSTSIHSVNNKLKQSFNEAKFSLLRQKMETLFSQSDGAIGYRNMSKIHVIFNDPCRRDYEKIYDRNIDSVVIASVPERNRISLIANEVVSMLREAGYLSYADPLSFNSR